MDHGIRLALIVGAIACLGTGLFWDSLFGSGEGRDASVHAAADRWQDSDGLGRDRPMAHVRYRKQEAPDQANQAADPPTAAEQATPPQPAAPAEPSVAAKPTAVPTYVVQRGDTPPSIAEQVYGSANKWRALLEANDHAPNQPLQPGQELRLPPLD